MATLSNRPAASTAISPPEQELLSTLPYLSLIIPAHNEEETIAQTLSQYVAFLERRVTHYEIWVILNGCHDGTAERVEAFRQRHPQVSWAMLAEAGKGGAVRLGFQLARGALVGFVDADGQITPQEFSKLLDYLKHNTQIDGAIASKYAVAQSDARAPLVRRWAGQAFSVLVQQLLRLPFSDTQCGAKLFHQRALKKILPKLQLTGWTFDVELLFHLCREGRSIVEIPITLRPEERPSQLRLIRAAPRMLWEILRLRRLVAQPEIGTWPEVRAQRLPQISRSS